MNIFQKRGFINLKRKQQVGKELSSDRGETLERKTIEEVKNDPVFLKNRADKRLNHYSDYQVAIISVGDKKRAEKGNPSWVEIHYGEKRKLPF